MRKTDIARKQAELEWLQKYQKATTERVRSLSHEIAGLEKKRRWQRIIYAGQIVEEAGILDTFNPNKFYELLIENRQRICPKFVENDF